MAERSGHLGKVVVRGADVDVQLEDAPVFEVDRGDHLLLSLTYEFEDTPDEKEHVRLRLEVAFDGGRGGVTDAEIQDMPVRDDSHRGAISVRARAPSADAEGVFHVHVEQNLQEWQSRGRSVPHQESRRVRGTFRVHVR